MALMAPIIIILGVITGLVTITEVAMLATAYVLSMNMSPLMFLIFVNFLFIFLGMIIDAIPAMLIFVPVILPIATALGIDPIHISVVIVTNLMIGLLTPPVGGLLYLEAKIANVPVDRLIKELVPFILVLFAVIALMTFVPSIVTFIPNLLF